MRQTGSYRVLGNLKYFIPFPLPPADPPLLLDTRILSLYGEASFALGQLNEMSLRLPDLKRFIKAYVIKEALLSSAIEGIHTTLAEAFTQSLEGAKPNKETQLVLNYTHALDAALHLVRDQNMPLTNRVILRAHEALMLAGEGDKADPGQFRKQSVRVGEHVPPPAPEVPILMGQLEKYINEPSDIPPLIKAGLAHVQFETIHPFLDGNGRIGRLLIVLIFLHTDLLHLPILYPSYYFKKHHFEYYQKLDRVRTHGDFEGWIAYYLQAIRDSARDGYTRAKEIESLGKRLKELIKTDGRFSKMRDTALSALDYLFTQPITTIGEVSRNLQKAYNTAHNVLNTFLKTNIVTEVPKHKRNKFYRFEPYLDLLEKEY